jgi:hypothetical protein
MADEPQSAAPAPAAASDKAPAAPTASENSAKAPARPATAAKADEEWKPPLGYKKEKRDGLVVYCRRDVESGSRFSHKTCYTREDLEFVIARNKADSDDLIRNTRVCGTSAVCSNP